GGVAAELDLAWWSTVFEEILRQDPAMAAQDGAALSRLVAEYRALDRRHLEDRALIHVAGSRESLRQRLHRCDEQTQALFGEIVEDRFTSLRQAVERYPDVTRHLRPVLVVGPMLVPHVLPPTRSEDLLVLDAASHLPVELVIGAVARARQVLVVGDTRCATGGALRALAEALPTLSLRSDASRRHPRLTRFLAEHGYGSALTATPLPSVAGLLSLVVVDGSGMPGPSGAVETTRVEVERVVELVIEHALTRPEESLAVVSPSPAHADRVREAVLSQVRQNPALGPFFDPGVREPFVAVDLSATDGLARDAVLLSVGFGRTPHGRVLHRFGPLAEEHGDLRLLAALGAARRRLTVVSALAAEDLDPDRIGAPGPALLRDLLVTAAADDPEVPTGADQTGHDRLVVDLAERLWRMGLTVAVDHGSPGGPILPLAVGHPDLPGEMLVAVLTDDEDYLAEPSIRVRDRQRAERLERLGWTVVHTWSAAAFLDPQAEADAVCQAVVDAYAERIRFRPAVAAVPAQVVDGGDAVEHVPAGDPAASSGPGAGDLAAAPDGAARDGAARDAAATEERAIEERAVPTPVQGVLEIRAGGSDAVAPEPPRPRPEVPAGLPIGAYTDDQLDDLASWLLSQDERDEAELVTALRAELGIKRRGVRVDTVIRGAARRALDR
ncbi:MAG TPA: hypothetical protein PKB06_09280, partial [Actinotalea sp.]|nr:hypothetical protein [Actinotalea sp.]